MDLRFSRRTFLASSTLAGLSALPFYRAIVPQVHAAAERPQFLLTYFFPFGVMGNQWYPDTLGSGFTVANKKSSSPLEAIRDDIIMFRNIDNAMGEKNECANSIDQHHAAVSSLWTNAAMDGGPTYCGEPSDPRFNTCDRPHPGGPSIDSVIAAHLSPNQHHDDVVSNLGIRSTDSAESHTRWLHQKMDGTTVESQDDPRIAFADLFGGAADIIAPQPTRPFTALKDAMRDDLLLFERHLALPERERFQLYMESFDAYERSLDVVLTQENLCQDLPTEEQFSAEFDEIRATNIWPLIRAQAHLAVLAMGCGIRRVATLHLTDGFSTYFIPKGPNDVEGTDAGHLGISHKQAGNATAKWENLNHHQAQIFADTILEMKEMPSPVTGGASLFDDTIALYASGQSGNGGGGHSKMRVPFTIAAGKSAGWVTGRHLDANFGTVGMVLRSVCNSFGMPDAPFGEEEFSSEPMGGLDSDVEVAGNYERGVLQYTDMTQRCRTHTQ